MSEKYPLRIEARPLLTCGVSGSGPTTIFILVGSGQSRAEAAITLWHEVVHILMAAGGHAPPTTSDELSALESRVESAAVRLAAACPEVVEFCGLEASFPK